MSSLLNQSVSGVQAGYGLYGQLDRALRGDPKKVHFVQGNKTVVEFDACLNEQHTINAAPTAYALEDGQTISDHIQVAPLELQLAGVKTDTPIDNRDELQKSLVVSAAAAVLGPLGTIAGSAGYLALNAQHKSLSPSQQCYEQLCRLAAGSTDIDSDFGPVQTTGPQLFDVVTSLKRYPSMCIKSMSVARDASTGYGIVFQLSLMQIKVVSSQQVEVTADAQPALSARKKKLAEGEKGEGPDYTVDYRQGVINRDKYRDAKFILSKRPDLE